jgi:antitoxin (DNA-binding transcriptional repressor) of toxin-antitoxin stability system
VSWSHFTRESRVDFEALGGACGAKWFKKSPIPASTPLPRERIEQALAEALNGEAPLSSGCGERFGCRNRSERTRSSLPLPRSFNVAGEIGKRSYPQTDLNMCYCVHRVRNMETEKIGMREFRENLAGYLESGRPLAITRHGETLGFYIPAQKRSRKAEIEAMRAAAKELDSMIASWGASEDELMQEYNEIRRASREKKRNSK